MRPGRADQVRARAAGSLVAAMAGRPVLRGFAGPGSAVPTIAHSTGAVDYGSLDA